ncbi:hypothetical protein Syun_003975 [Stephania yunnanensis]|uniref:Uncharacterized protein n=1 Tax=Stephania yunnanensis TaxID=152371 RepID=A0AAP0Q0R1_9MAGN
MEWRRGSSTADDNGTAERATPPARIRQGSVKDDDGGAIAVNSSADFNCEARGLRGNIDYGEAASFRRGFNGGLQRHNYGVLARE